LRQRSEKPESAREGAGGGATRDRRLVRAVGAWFRACGRDLPWRSVDRRTGRRDAYRSLVSEFMLQQTQVSRVLGHYDRFLVRFPDVRALARADIADVLALWSGLGYYRRARLLHAAARVIVESFAGEVPRDPEGLMTLPGVGRYTAGAIASMVYGAPAPLVDGNVTRVLLRLEGREMEAPAGLRWAWGVAQRLAPVADDDPGLFNEGLMELGAMVCTPVGPACGECPLAALCRAREQGLQHRIPAPRARPERATVVHSSVLVRDGRGGVLVERRPDTGLWAGMWQAPTLETKARPSPKRLAAWLGVSRLRRVGGFTHLTSHRAVEFAVFDAGVAAAAASGVERRWVRSLSGLAVGNAQRRVLKLAWP
jgi:A/G-specific adenine glycosylase